MEKSVWDGLRKEKKKEGMRMAKDADGEILGMVWDGGQAWWQHTDFSVSREADVLTRSTCDSFYSL